MGFPYFGNERGFGFLPPGVNGDVQVFNASAGDITQWQQWVKPRGVTMVWMMLVGGGGGGGGGFTGTSGAARGGGAGGSSSGVAVHLFPAIFLPDILKVSVGLGGAGSTGSGVNGSAATLSIVAVGVGLTAGSTIPNIIAQSNSSAAPGGNAGAGSGSAASGGTAGQVSKATQGWAQAYSMTNAFAGRTGASGGNASGANGSPVTGWSLSPLTAGTGGGGITSGAGFTGGPSNIIAIMDHSDGGFNPTAFSTGGAAGASGKHGIQSWRPFIMLGGTGGGSEDAAAGGDGMDGGLGAGGGGGGGGTTGGRGGAGGNGIVIIISW